MLLATIVCTSDPYIFAEPVRIEANGKPIDVTTGHAAPLVYDFDGDGEIKIADLSLRISACIDSS